jgi:hypothetical protein
LLFGIFIRLQQPPPAEVFEPPFEKFDAPPAFEQDGAREIEQLEPIGFCTRGLEREAEEKSLRRAYGP